MALKKHSSVQLSFVLFFTIKRLLICEIPKGTQKVFNPLSTFVYVPVFLLPDLVYAPLICGMCRTYSPNDQTISLIYFLERFPN